MAEVTFHRVRSVRLENVSAPGGGRWFQITVTDSEGEEHEINCHPTKDNEIPVVFNEGMERKSDD